MFQFYNLKYQKSIYSLLKNKMLCDNSEPAVANFVQKSFEIISCQQNHHIIEWLASGKQFLIKDTDLFESVILPHYFRHRNINSFIRQLNMYGFHKSRKQPTKNIFSHPNFVKGKPENLINVRRKLKEQKTEENPVSLKKIKSDVLIAEPLKDMKDQKAQQMQSRQVLKSKQHIEINLQKRQKQLQKTAIKHQPLMSICSMQNMDDFLNQNPQQKSSDWPLRGLFGKSIIMELNPQVYNMKYENITSLHHIDEVEFDFGADNATDEIEKERKRLNSRMVGYNILQTINFMSEFQL